MKILYFAFARFPTERAHGVQIAHMCNAFAESCEQVTLAVPSISNPVKGDPFVYYSISKNFTVKYLFCIPKNAATRLSFLISFSVFVFFSFLLAVKTKPGVVYSRHEIILWAISFVTPYKKLIWESHEAKFNFAAKRLFKKGVKCVAISEGIRDFYIAQGISSKQILVAHDGIDESFFASFETKEQARTRLGIVTNKPVAMYIGGIDQWKGIETFFMAAKHNQDVQFVVIGGRTEEVEQYTKEYPGVQFLGQRPYNELKDNQQAADVLVIPNTAKNNLSAKFTSPLKLFAHLTSKVPLVVSDIPSMRNVVSEKHVTFFKPDDPKDFAEQIQLVIKSAGQSEEKANHAFSLAKGYTWSTRASSILSFAKNS